MKNLTKILQSFENRAAGLWIRTIFAMVKVCTLRWVLLFGGGLA